MFRCPGRRPGGCPSGRSRCRPPRGQSTRAAVTVTRPTSLNHRTDHGLARPCVHREYCALHSVLAPVGHTVECGLADEGAAARWGHARYLPGHRQPGLRPYRQRVTTPDQASTPHRDHAPGRRISGSVTTSDPACSAVRPADGTAVPHTTTARPVTRTPPAYTSGQWGDTPMPAPPGSPDSRNHRYAQRNPA